MKDHKNLSTSVSVFGAVIVLAVIIVGTVLLTRQASADTEKAVNRVSLLYLDELAGRREQVVENNLQNSIKNIQVAVGLMSEEDTCDIGHLQAYQARMKQLYTLEKFAFVDESGRIYTALGIQGNIDDYAFDYRSLSGPEISILNPGSRDKKVIIAIPVDIPFDGEKLKVCFMEIDMDEMLSGVSMESKEGDATFCNLYTRDGIALSDTILGGLAVEDNLLEAMRNAEFEAGYSYESFLEEFGSGTSGEVSFTYDGIRETLSYEPVKGTDWLLTYLVRESVISNEIGSITNGIIIRGILQTVITVAFLVGLFSFIILQIRKNSKILLEKETVEAENRIKQQEMQEKIDLQDKLLEEERERAQQDNLITAMASDYRSVYYVNLDENDGVCYREDPADHDQNPEGKHFCFSERFEYYARKYVAEEYREGFLKFIDIHNIRSTLLENRLITYRYLVRREDREYYEMLRMAGVRLAEKRDDHKVHAVGIGFTIIDKEMREEMARNELLSDALTTAEQANKAKTAFLSNMSHEIRTPMNAIIGLDSIALNDPDTPEKTKEYLAKIGESADHLLRLINDILDVSRIESGRMIIKNEEFSFPQLLEAVNTMFSAQCQEKGLDYQCHVSSDVDDFYIGDGLRIRQVLINILGNAVKFTKSGSVRLDIRKTAAFEKRSTLLFEVSDTGIGISEEFMPHLFDTFAQEDSSSTNKYGSSGLGMAITKNIVEMMNGNIEVKSKKGEGSTFSISLTLSDSEKTEGQTDVEIVPEQMSVLVIDDDQIACEHAKIVLEKAGIAAEMACSGEEAIEMVRLRYARRTPYNLILVDWKMPGMDGVETAKRIREIVGNESAIIILTAYKWDDVLEEALQAGVDSFIPKPLFATVVIEEFRSALKKKKQGSLPGNKAELSGRRILLAEDMQVNAEIMLMVLEMRGMKADTAENGRIALEKFRNSEAGYYDAILMDMRMPEMDGLEATRKIRELDREDAKTIPIIALTANAFDEDVQRSLQAGLNAHLLII